MNMQVHIYVAKNNQIQVLLQGPAQGVVTFDNFETFARFIEGCQEFISKRTKTEENPASIPRPFLDAFND